MTDLSAKVAMNLEMHCHYCCKSSNDVPAMVRSEEGVCICNECVGVCEDIMLAGKHPCRAVEMASLIAEQAKRIGELERAMSDVLPGPYYMDPPDGGDVTIIEQLSRMAKDAARWRALELRTNVESFSADGRWVLLVRLPWAHSFIAAIDAALSAVQAKEKGE